MTDQTSPDTRDEPRDASWSKAFLGYLGQRELRVARCRASGLILDFPELNEAHLHASVIEWIPASGRARLFSFVIYRRQYHPDFPPPYNVAAVALQEGPLLISTVIAEPHLLAINMSLKALFDAGGQLVFEPNRTP